MRSFTLLMIVVVGSCASQPVDKVQQVGGQPGQIVQGQGHVSQGGIQKPDQSYVAVGNGQYPGNGYQGQGSVNVVQGVQEQHPVHGVQGQGHLSQGDIQKPDQSYVAVGNGQYPGNGFHGLGSVNVAQGVQEQHPVHGVQGQGHLSQGDIQKPDQSYVAEGNGQYPENGFHGLGSVNVAQGLQEQHPVHGVQGQGHVSQGGIQKPDQSYVTVSNGQYRGNGYQGLRTVNVAQGVQGQHPVHGVQGQGHVSQGGIQKPDQSYVPVSGQYPGNGYQGQGSVNVAQGVQEQHPVHGVQGQVEHGQVVPVGIISQDSEVNPDGTFHNVWESENGIKVQEEASVKLLDDNTVSQTVTGQISYVDNEGKQVLLRYVADETGFHPEGDHLPTPPPLPTGIARGLEWIRAHPPAEETKLHEETVLNEKHFAQERTGGY